MSTNELLTLERAVSPDGVLLLGALALKQLQEYHTCAFVVNKKNTIEIINPVELAMDLLPEEIAIRILSENFQYDESRLIQYLQARDQRIRLLHIESVSEGLTPR